MPTASASTMSITAGARRQGYHWTPRGAQLTLDFFARLEELSVIGVFASSHPNPALRLPFIQDEVARFRSSGGTWWRPLLPVLP